MRESTKKALEEATRRCKDAGVKLSVAGFKYHAERIWLGVTEDDNVVLVEVPVVYKDDTPDELHVFVYHSSGSKELEAGKPVGKKKANAS